MKIQPCDVWSGLDNYPFARCMAIRNFDAYEPISADIRAVDQMHRTPHKPVALNTLCLLIGFCRLEVSKSPSWQDLAAVYANLALWHDAEVCLEKAQALKLHSAATWQAIGTKSHLHICLIQEFIFTMY